MSPAARLVSITECAGRVLSKPQVLVTTICSYCDLPSGQIAVDPEQADRRFDRMHQPCVAPYRARFIGAPTVAA